MEVKVNNLSKVINNTYLLKNINLSLESGHIYGFVGANGSGKTVLFKTILGFMKESEGEILLNGEKRKDFLQDVGMIIERPNFIPYYNCMQNLKTIASYENKVNDEEIRDIIKIVGLNPNDKKKLKNYSLGMQQKLALALALMENPKILILDEPLNAMDEESVHNMRKLILKEKDKGKLILIASHIKDDMEEMCDYIYKMKGGEIINEE